MIGSYEGDGDYLRLTATILRATLGRGVLKKKPGLFMSVSCISGDHLATFSENWLPVVPQRFLVTSAC